MSAPISILALGSVSALGHERCGIRKNYEHCKSRLAPRELGDARLSVGALSRESEGALAAFVASDARYAALDRSVQLGLFAAERVLAQLSWDRARGLGVAMGSSRGATGLLERRIRAFASGGLRAVPALTSPTTTLGSLSSWIAQRAGGHMGVELSSTCSSSLSALGTAAAWLRSGMARSFLAGGSEAPLTAFTAAQMLALRIVSREADEEFPCRPCALDARRNTMALGEGACVLALELAPGDASGAERLGAIRGLGFAVEPVSTPTSLSAEGTALRCAMQRALADAGLERVDVIVTHTPGTKLGDRAELSAIRAVFGGTPPLLTSNKWLSGHTLGASGVLSIEYALFLLSGLRPLPYPYPVPFDQTPGAVETVMVNSVGFGGNAGSVVLSR